MKKFQRDVIAILHSEDSTDPSEEVMPVFNNVVSTLDLQSKSYALSDIRGLLNEMFHAKEIDISLCNRRVKNMLIKQFSDGICFSYPKDRNKSQMAFSSKIHAVDIADTIHRIDVVKLCGEILLGELAEFDFHLEGSFCSSEDLKLSLKHYMENRPKNWNTFFNSM